MYSSNTNSIHRRVKKKNGRVDKRRVNDQLYELGHRIKRLKKQKRYSKNYELPLERLRNKRRKLSKIARFGAGGPIREIKESKEYDGEGYYQMKDGTRVHHENIFNVKDNPHHEHLVGDGYGFDIVSAGEASNTRWRLKHKKCLDVDCTIPNLGYYENDDGKFILLPNYAEKYLDYQTAKD